MTSYFSSIPVVSYEGRKTIDVTRRVAIRSAVAGDPRLMRPYEVPAGQRADQVAQLYYGDPEREWLVFLSADVYDPYHDWYLSYEDFLSFLEDKYGSVEEAQERVHHWAINWYDDDSEISASDFAALPYQLKKYYEPVFAEDTGRILSYARRAADVECSTNMVVTVGVSNSSLVAYERVQVWDGPTLAGDVETAWANSSQVVLVNVQSGLDVGYSLLGMTSGSFPTITSVTYTSNTIPIDERVFWSPVTCYDYENDRNESRKSVRLVDAGYVSSIEIEMKKLMGK